MEWITKQNNGYAKKTDDVTISAIKDGKEISVIFRNEVDKKITRTGYIVIGIDTEHDRIYFRESVEHEGYLISRRSHSKARKVNGRTRLVNRALTEVLKGYKTDYKLNLDYQRQMAYISLERQNNELD
jgi:hypothetical protein